MRLRSILFIYFLVLVPIASKTNLFGQTSAKEYLNKDWEKTTAMDSAVYYREGNQNAEGMWEGEVKMYDLTNRLRRAEQYKNGRYNGVQVMYYENGRIAEESTWYEGFQGGKLSRWYENGQKEEEGEWEKFGNPKYIAHNFWDSTGVQTLKNGNGELVQYRNGKRFIQEVYKDGNLIRGISYGEEGQEYTYHTYREQMPEFPGGIDKLIQYLSKNVKYPKEASKRRVQGRVMVMFVVGSNGVIKDIQTVGEPIGYGLEEEAVRVVAQMPAWKPGIQYGKAVPVKYSLPIRFSF